MLPIRDAAGNALLDLRFGSESTLDGVVMSLVVVRHGREVLLVFDRWRRQWELPGGTLEPGETAHDAAVRELAEETGIGESAVSLRFGAVAEFALAGPPHRELGAIFVTESHAPPRLRVNDEVSAFRWWRPTSPLIPGQSPIDAEIARRVG